jgi:hypothetical protein
VACWEVEGLVGNMAVVEAVGTPGGKVVDMAVDSTTC